jgi:hypothetical protein
MRIFCLILFFLPAILKSQVIEFSKYNWNYFPEVKAADSLKSENGVLITLERRIVEVYVNREDIFEEINIFHRKIRVESHDAIDRHNKIYVPVNNVIEIINIKARFISPDGKLIEVPQENIRQVSNLENEGDYKIFAIEGAQLGGEIEYFYVLRKKFNAYGTVYVQSNEPKAIVESIFSFPSKLSYIIKTYNGFPSFETMKDTINDKTYMRSKSDFVPSLADEKYAFYKANLMRYEYTLAFNHYSSSLRIYSWSKISNNIYSHFFNLSRKELSAAKSIITALNLKNLSEEQKIRKIEGWLKSEIAISEGINYIIPIDKAIQLKQTSKTGATKLLVALLNQAGISFEIVVTCNQEERSFDPEFNGWNFLDDYLIFFPEINKIIVPDNPSARLGIIPYNYQGAYGLFMFPVSYNKELKTLGYEIKQIPVEHFEKNTDSLIISLHADLSKLTLQAKIHRVLSGELAASVQSFWKFADEERHNKIISTLFTMGDQNPEIIAWSVKNDDLSDIGMNPFIIDVELNVSSLIEMAGNDIIFKLGETIGEQSEMYQASSRKMPVNINDAHNYFRKITFTIPEGYIISNPNDLNMKVELLTDGKVSCCFNSWFELTDNKLVVFSKEYYTEVSYPAERFGEFRNVINAAADFNKKTVVLTKK